MRRLLVSLLSFAVLAVPTVSWEASTSSNLSIAVTASQAITAVNLSNGSFTGGAPTGTVVGAISVAMSPAAPAFSGTLALSGANASSFQIAGANLQTKGVVPAGTYHINVVATQAGATGSPFTQAETITGTSPPPPPPSASACPRGTAYQDGCAGAPTPAGAAQYPGLLAKYGARRPPWNVAGVDYYVGYPSNQTFKSWTVVNGAYGGASWGNNGDALYCNSGNAVLNGIDFTAANSNGAYGNVYLPPGGCTSLTITNSKIGCTSSSPGGVSYWFIHAQQNPVTIVLKNNIVDYSACNKLGGTQATGNPTLSLITSQYTTSLTLQYNVLRHYCDHTVETLGSVSLLDFKFNLLDDPNNCKGSEAHMNFTQFGGGTARGVNVSFNTVYLYQSPSSGNEAFQFYFNGGGTQVSPILSNNTLVDTIGELCYAMFGTGVYSPATTMSGSGTNSQNYFGLYTGLCGAGIVAQPYYPRSFSSGWNNAGNINMNTGALITSF